MIKELPWIDEARKHIGLRENPSKTEHNPVLLGMLNDMSKFSNAAKPWWEDDEAPWCGLFLGYTLGVAGRYVVREWYRARAWQDDRMTQLARPAYGCIAVIGRQGGGHVFYPVGKDQHGNIMGLGGNQSNMVNIMPFSRERLINATYWWPSTWRNGVAIKSSPLPDRYRLPLLTSDGRLSTNEA